MFFFRFYIYQWFSSMSSLVLLTTELTLYPKKKKYTVNLTADTISYSEVCDVNKNATKLSDTQVIFLKDVIGCDLQSSKTKEKIAAHLTIYWYPHIAKWHKKQTKRIRHQVIFTFLKHNSYEKNAGDVREWKTKIDSLLHDQNTAGNILYSK